MFEPDFDSSSEGCGYEWEHTLRLVDEWRGERTYECTECGAEVAEEDKATR